MPTPEHLHLALNHFPIIGLPVAAIVVAWGLARKSPETLRAGLVLLVLCAAFTPAVMSTGESAHDAYDGADFVDSAGYAWMTEHGERAGRAAFAAYVAGAAALLAFGLAFFAARAGRIFAAFAVVAALVASGLGVWTADAGGKIRRPDFRETPAETLSTQTPESP